MWLTCDIVDETYDIVDIVDDIDYGIMVDIVDEYWWMMVGWWLISLGILLYLYIGDHKDYKW